jgi:hypothetical protein
MFPSCKTEVIEPVPDEPAPLSAEVLASISVERLRDDVAVLAADEMGGRTPGSYGHELARNYILAEMESSGMIPIRLDGSFIQEYENDPIAGRYQMEPDGSVIPSNVTGGTNLIGVIPGSDPVLADEYVVLMAHYDHLGVTQTGEVYNGAFDNATSVAMALEIARVFTEHDIQPKRTIVFLITDDEESGLDGAQAWLEDPEVPLGDVVLGLSADPTGRPVLPDFWPIVLIGLERSPSLLARMKKTRRYSELPVFFVHRDVVPVFSSDHDRFFAWQDPIAAGWYTNPGMSFYHTVDDTPETIDYRVLGANTRYLAQVLVDLGGDDQRYPYEGEFPVDGSTAQDLKELFEGVLASIELSTRERERTEYFISEIDRVVEADSVDVLDNPDSLFFAGAYFLLFELTYAHPGEVPPPFPSENE